ncbi:radical SAM protein [Actinomadura luteofluorescens]|uniref:radical SAM protein n=1 Tax=Actinomadura luteofluorescens TaxID=46163 RepID=UPI00362CA976
MSPPAAREALPFREFILKIHSRCNLACDYCYVYEMGDRSWRDRPVTMPPEVVDAAARRIGDHVRAHAVPGVDIVLHGGEPLLAAPPLIERVVRSVSAEGVSASFFVQTNGTRLTDDRLAQLDRLGVRIGVSVDGDAAAQDRHRRLPDGRGSHASVAPRWTPWPPARTGTCSPASSARSTSATTRSRPTRRCCATARPASTSCSRTGTGRRLPRGAPRGRPPRRTPTGSSRSSTAGTARRSPRRTSGRSATCSPCCSAGPSATRRSGSAPCGTPSSRPTARSSIPTCSGP